jgi:4-amino-4-deoxy-L-arabinose transferase-like glycosyltransferase
VKAQPDPVAGDRSLHRRHLLVLGLLVAFVYLPGIASRGLWNPDEPRYAEVGREMLEGDGSWLVPQLNGRLYAQKPPLHFWTIAGFGWLRGGVDEVAARLPAVCAALGTTWLVYLFGTLLFERNSGLIAAVAFATCARTLWQGRIGQIDMTLAFFVVLAVYCWTRSYLGERTWIWGFWLATGLATLTKGPAGLFPPLLSIVVFLALGREWSQIRALAFGRGLLLYLGVVASWLGPATAIAGLEYPRGLIFGQTLHRYFATTGHPHAFYYYLTLPPADFFPWFFLLPLALAVAWRVGDEQARARLRFLLTWTAVTVAFFSISPGKRSVYIAAIYVPLAIATGVGIWRMASSRLPSRRALVASVAPVALIACLLPASALLAERIEPEIERLGPELVPSALAASLPLALGALAALAFACRRRPIVVMRCLAAGMAITAALAVRLVVPLLDPVKSARAMSELVTELVPPEEPIAIYPMLEAGFLFYTGRTTVELQDRPLEAVLEYARQPGRRWLLIERDELAALPEPLPMVEVARDDDWEQGFVLLTTAPWPAPR